MLDRVLTVLTSLGASPFIVGCAILLAVVVVVVTHGERVTLRRRGQR